jgi:hypothetical protein
LTGHRFSLANVTSRWRRLKSSQSVRKQTHTAILLLVSAELANLQKSLSDMNHLMQNPNLSGLGLWKPRAANSVV